MPRFATLRVDPTHPIKGTRTTQYATHDPETDTVLFTREAVA